MVSVGRMRIAGRVRMLVMLAVFGDPGCQSPLHRHRTERGPEEPDIGTCRERFVREEAVEPGSDPDAGRNVHADHDGEVGSVEGDLPHCRDDEREGDKREDHGNQGDDADSGRAAAVDFVVLSDRFVRSVVFGRGGRVCRVKESLGGFDQTDRTDIKFASQGYLLRVAHIDPHNGPGRRMASCGGWTGWRPGARAGSFSGRRWLEQTTEP